jgi:hypothetical protein
MGCSEHSGTWMDRTILRHVSPSPRWIRQRKSNFWSFWSPSPPLPMRCSICKFFVHSTASAAVKQGYCWRTQIYPAPWRWLSKCNVPHPPRRYHQAWTYCRRGGHPPVGSLSQWAPPCPTSSRAVLLPPLVRDDSTTIIDCSDGTG